ncbi:MAG: lysostaphin resistance A-like protein [Marmoricola sp.]
MTTQIRPSAFPQDARTSTRSSAGRPWWVARRRPVRTAVALAAVPVTITIAIGLLGGPLLGDASQLTRRLIAVLMVAAAALLVVGRAGAWRRVGAGGAATWRDLGVLAVPAAVALAPALTGFAIPAAGTLAVLVVGYAATGVFEELWHRGVILDTLRPVGMRRAAVIGGALFAASHLGNIAFGQPVMVSLAQSVGAFCFGTGFSVFRWRTDAVWLLVAVHGIGDLMFKITALHGGALWAFLVGHDIAMLLWGLSCLRGLPAGSDGGTTASSLAAGGRRTD